jgi:hypothetical protein
VYVRTSRCDESAHGLNKGSLVEGKFWVRRVRVSNSSMNGRRWYIDIDDPLERN